MSDASWTDRIAGERMAVDRQFADQVEASAFSSQQWGLVMTAVQFEIENPADPEEARIVADASRLPSVLPEMDRVENQSPMGGAAGDSGSSGSGLIAGIKDSLGIGGGGSNDEERKAEAADLAQRYADRLQEQLESKGRWEAICEQAQSSD